MRWIFIGLLLAASIFLFYSGPQDFPQRSVKALWDLGHVGYFLIFTLIWLGFGRVRQMSPLWMWMLGLVLGLSLGLVIEVLQQAVSRSASWQDVARNMVGVIVALSFSTVSSPQQLKGALALKMVAVLLLIASMLPLGRALYDEFQASRQFPVLADFSSRFELDRWEGDADFKRQVSDGKAYLEVSLNTRQYSGVALNYPPKDWRGYDSLNIEIKVLEAQPLGMTLRIHDDFHNNEFSDRYNRSFKLNPGHNSLRVSLAEVEDGPVNRPMDMGHIANLRLFSVSLSTPRTVHLEKIYLSKN